MGSAGEQLDRGQCAGRRGGHDARQRGVRDLDPTLAKKQFADIVDEVVQQFTAKHGVKVRISIELEAEAPTGFDDGVQRAVSENCRVLKFKAADFEVGD